MIGLLGDHIWQSTLFLFAAMLLTLALKNNRAAARYWVWLAASIKFLLPFAALVAVGRRFASQSRVDIEPLFVLDAVSQPFSGSEPMAARAISPTMIAPGIADQLPAILLTIWACGTGAVLVTWWIRWRQVAAVERAAVPVTGGRELAIVRHLERSIGRRRSLAMVESDASFEPAVFGIRQPTLLWPRGIGDRLDTAQVEALLAHELCHVRRRDNLTATVHMAVEALFWFHPLVWWLGARLVDERERACDEEVLRLGSEPQVYAQTIIKTCEFFVELPRAGVAGVTGSDLKKRMERIMRNDRGKPLGTWKRLTLAAAVSVIIAAPVAAGALGGSSNRAGQSSLAQSPPAPAVLAPAFDVASVKQNKSGAPQRGIGFQPGGRFRATNMTLRGVVAAAYGTPEPLPLFRVLEGPSWIDSDRFDIEAIAGSEFAETQSKPGWTVRGELMLRTLLADRFKLVAHQETRDLPAYALVMARSDGRLGQQLRRSSGTEDCQNATPIPCGGFGFTPPNRLSARQLTIDQFTRFIMLNAVDRPVVNRTGLTGTFNLDLEYTRSLAPSVAHSGANDQPVDPGTSIFTALQEQLELRLQPITLPLDVVIIDRVEQPTEN